jgi:nicotinate phosphoribosyltransferase
MFTFQKNATINISLYYQVQRIASICLRTLILILRYLIAFAELRLTPEEREFLTKKCPYLKPEYIDYLASFRFYPSQVSVTFTPKPDDANMGRIEMTATGPWVETILWEVPLMACLSEMYFLTTDRDWSYDGQEGD